MKLLFVMYSLICFACYSNSYGQQLPKKKVYYQKGSYVKINLAGIFDPVSPGAQIGIEKLLSKRWAAEATAGIGAYIAYPQKNRDSLYHHNQKYKLQAKHYFTNYGFYFAIELFHARVKYNSFNNQYLADDYYRFSNAVFTKRIWGNAYKIGNLIPVAANFYIEPATALGIRWVRTSVKAQDIQLSGPRNTDWADFTTRIGDKATPHIAFELKLGYLIH